LHTYIEGNLGSLPSGNLLEIWVLSSIVDVNVYFVQTKRISNQGFALLPVY